MRCLALAALFAACGSSDSSQSSLLPDGGGLLDAPPADAGSPPADAPPAAPDALPPSPDAAPGGPDAPDPRLAIARENQLEGTGAWTILTPAMNHEVEGYADVVSTAAGSDVHVAVSTTPASAYTYRVFRTGSYGGQGGRLYLASKTMTGATQAAPSFDSVTGLVVAHWTTSFTIATRHDDGTPWPTGVYLVLLQAAGGAQSYVIFILRDDRRDAEVAVELPTATWQAYNSWGGESLYFSSHGMSGGKARKVSYDRPYEAALSFGAGLYPFHDMKLVMWLEARGYDVEYLSSSDTGDTGGRIGAHRAFLAVGHDEYNTIDSIDRLEDAREAGTNLIFLTGDTLYWQIRFEDGGRTQVCYKDQVQEDPLVGVDDLRVAIRFRDPPVNRPENSFLGVMSHGEATDDGDWKVTDSDHWIYAGTGLRDGDLIQGLVGIEWDTFYDVGNEPAGLTVLADSPIPGHVNHNAVIIEGGGSGFLFDAGSMGYVNHLDDERVSKILENALTHAGATAR